MEINNKEALIEAINSLSAKVGRLEAELSYANAVIRQLRSLVSDSERGGGEEDTPEITTTRVE